MDKNKCPKKIFEIKFLTKKTHFVFFAWWCYEGDQISRQISLQPFFYIFLRKGFKRVFFYPFRITMYSNNKILKSRKFLCEHCNYICSKKSDFTKHLATLKHRMASLDKKTRQNSPKHIQSEYECECGKKYKYQSGLCKHKKYCTYINDGYNSYETDDGDNSIKQQHFIDLLKQNQEFKEMIIEQNKTIMELSNRTNITNNTTNNNQKFNLNFFLNTTCKDAMNMSEFIENINIDFKDIENIGKNGYVAGMTNMILSRIKDLDVSKRPLHCTDLKRETMYIKDNDEWSKDTPDNQRLKNMITIVAEQNYGIVPLWREKHPECQHWDNPKYDFCISMMRNILGDMGEEQIRLDNKIIKNLSRHILVEKN